jgi:LytS/YehU family sensor histidine kinase
MLYDCKERYVPLSKEIEHLRNFTQLSELQIEERGVVKFKTFTTVTTQADYHIAPLILIVFIENAFKHSQANQSSNILIDIQIQLSEDGRLAFYCKNNFQAETKVHDTFGGIGLENVKKRLQLLYPNVHQLDIGQTDNYYEVHLSMQLKK